jgi:hypothetical protein
MRKKWSFGVAVMVFVFLGICGAAAQGPGPQGAGADKAAQKKDASHSYNPFSWIKKESKTSVEKPKKIKHKKGKSTTTDTSERPK